MNDDFVCCRVTWVAKSMTWAFNWKNATFWHPFDSNKWKYINDMYKGFSKEP